jgi:hypothetical protein
MLFGSLFAIFMILNAGFHSSRIQGFFSVWSFLNEFFRYLFLNVMDFFLAGLDGED